MNIFGGNTGMSYDDIQRKRKIAERLMAQNASAPRNVGEGLHAIGRALAARAIEKRTGRAEKDMRDRFSQQFDQVAPQSQAMIDLYNNPMASEGHKKILGALMKGGVPGYSRGGKSKGGLAIVGEAGPELVELPKGTQIFGPGYDPGYEAPLADGYMVPPEPDDYMREELGDDLFQMYQNMDRQQRLDFLNNPANGFVPPAPEDPNGMIPTQDVPMSRFDDAASFQTADLDAFKLMQIEPQYAPPVSNDANSTEARRLQLLRRAMFADAALEDPRLAKAMTRLDNSVASKFGALGRLYTNDEYELGRLMAEQFASAILRGDSGAQTPEPEVQRYIRQYFPLPNETDDQIQAKRAMRREEIRALIQSLPDDARPAAEQIQQEIEELKRQADTSAVSDEDREFLKSLGID